MTHYPENDESLQLMPTLSYLRLKTEQPLSNEELYAKIRKTVTNPHDVQIFEAFLIFNKHVLKTNFYQPTKLAISFRLDPSFLPEVEYPKMPHGLFLVVGSDFRGFHIRFRDVARGGIRIIRSRGKEQYNNNARRLFDENYGLASTQALKNKDIPEGGAKGTILPSLGADPETCFRHYVDAILDLLLPGQTPGIKGPIVDLLGAPEVLFFGPDEGTAGFMDWAAGHARSRQASFWKSFTTGKSAKAFGGIPHDTYGMTSLSVRQYVEGIYHALGWESKEITKFQTGGPDGDLGSNEILLSKPNEKIVAIIDGSGVLHDPKGLNHNELLRLAKLRVPVENFDTALLGPEGYLIRVDDKDVTLPSGEPVSDGTEFRNVAHLRFKSDIFVPCGGRPESINITNVAQLFDADGKPHFKAVVEGANLFFTQQARLYLEKKGVVVFKDSSANKGGVTSSSLEVLAGLGLSDEEYEDLMIRKNGTFYDEYVKDIQQMIATNGQQEFKCIWEEYHRRNGTVPRTLLSDELSSSLNVLQVELEESKGLYELEASTRKVLQLAMPKTLVNKVGLDTLIKRLPEPYLRAVWSAYVSSHHVYLNGINASQVDFFLFFSSLAKA
jgi:glutamate dehydrogenase